MRKTFHDGPEAARAAAARREFARLERFAAALADVPGAACPRPLELLADPPGLRMQRAAGVDLFAFLGRHRLGAPLRERLAATMAAAIRAYVESSGEPCPDFNFNNVLYDPATGTLTFVDLGAPQDAVAPAPGLSPYEVTAGDLLGSLIFQSARPRGLRRRGRHAETAALAAAIVRALRGAEGVRLRPAELARATEAAYRRCAFGRSRRRTAWYATAGFVLGRRVRLGPVTVGPPAPWRVGR